MAEQTAVEWLVNKLQNRQNRIFDGFPHLSLDKIYDQAKQMEKEQICDAFDKGKWDTMAFKGTLKEQYYNETYGK